MRIFTVPRSLNETLAKATPSSEVPRSIPELPAIPEIPIIPPATQKPNGHLPTMSVYDEPPRDGVTFAYQDKLPKLPIPELSATCDRYITALKPLQTAREHAETKHAVQEFLRHDGVDLQEKLKKYAEGRTSYIEQFC